MFESIDMLGSSPNLFVKGRKRFKTRFGGIISILSAILTIGFAMYFIVNLLMRKNFSIYLNQASQDNPFLNISHSPLAFALGNGFGQMANSSVATIIFSYWIYPPGSTTPTNKIIPLEKCSIKTHFSEYQSYFKNVTWIENYMCLPPNSNLTLSGLDGDYIVGNNYINVYFTKCVNNSLYNPNSNCLSSAAITSELTNLPIFINQIYLDYQIDHSIVTSPISWSIKSEKMGVSLSIFQRYFTYLKATEYNSDFGFVFSDLKTQTFMQYDKSSVFVTINPKSIIPDLIALSSFYVSKNKDIHTREFTKLQSVIANIGGIIQSILSVSAYLVTFFSDQLMAVDCINSSLNFHKINNLETKRTFQQLETLEALHKKKETQIATAAIKNIKPQSPKSPKRKNSYKNINQEIITLHLIDLICYKKFVKEKNRSNFDKIKNSKKIIAKRLSIDYLLRLTNTFDRVIQSIFNKNQITALSILTKFNYYDVISQDKEKTELDNVVKTPEIKKLLQEGNEIDIRLFNMLERNEF
jgi:hypothetical protein